MASGDLCVDIIRPLKTKTLAANPGVIEDASTPVCQFPVYWFSHLADNYLDLLCRLMENYSGLGLNLHLPWGAISTSATKVRWAGSLRRLNYSAEDIDNSFNFATNAKGVSSDTPGTVTHLVKPVIAFANGTEMDNLVAGELALCRIWRDTAHADDNYASFAGLLEAVWFSEQ